jgi:NADH-quinone oxidoreductase subunit K
MNFNPAQIAVVGVVGLLGAGIYGLLVSRNLIKIVVALQIMVKAALLGLIAAGSISGQVNLGQSLALTVIVADTIVAVMGIALGVQIRRRVGTLDLRDLSKLRG